jgi:hypothetical protein
VKKKKKKIMLLLWITEAKEDAREMHQAGVLETSTPSSMQSKIQARSLDTPTAKKAPKKNIRVDSCRCVGVANGKMRQGVFWLWRN